MRCIYDAFIARNKPERRMKALESSAFLRMRRQSSERGFL